MRVYAHSLDGKTEEYWQTLEEHHNAVAKMAAQFASPWAPETAALLGRIHDIGKNSDAFQMRLRDSSIKVDHTSAAYLYLLKAWSIGECPGGGGQFAQLLAFPLLGHHGGMPDIGASPTPGTLEDRISNSQLKKVPNWKPKEAAPLPRFTVYSQELQPLISGDNNELDAFATAFMLRMLYSCLVDADFLDTERFCSLERHNLRPEWPDLADIERRFRQFMVAKGFLKIESVSEEQLAIVSKASCGTEEKLESIRMARSFMLQKCLDAASEQTGIFSLTMPTGGGKTLSSMAFALRHAKEHNLQRIIMVVPYTSIIEQNADVLREALGENAVLEHHSNYKHPEDDADGEESSLAYKLSTENWAATVIITTSVQFFESLFSNRPSKCRKLHNLAHSVIILDEVQMLPVHFVEPCIAALRVLAEKYGSSVVLCTATQPALMEAPYLKSGFARDKVKEIIPVSVLPVLFRIFERTQVKINKEPVDDGQLADAIMADRQVLCIVNSRRHARELFALLDRDDANFHLSAAMTPDHRTKVLAMVRERLTAGLPCRVISTSLIECGVDISFPLVMREKNGLDVLAQAAGRCNREGAAATGRVICFTSTTPGPKRAPELNRRKAAFDQVADRQPIFDPETVSAYFEKLYAVTKYLDEKKILKDTIICRNSSYKSIWRFSFKQIAEKFKFIGQETVNVIIERGEAAELLKQEEKEKQLLPSTLARLQRHGVQVYRHELEKMQEDGRIEERFGFLHVLSGGVGYDEHTGLDVKLEAGLPIEELLY